MKTSCHALLMTISNEHVPHLGAWLSRGNFALGDGVPTDVNTRKEPSHGLPVPGGYPFYS